MGMNETLGSRSGFSLLELLVGLSLFSIGLLAISLLEIYSIRTASRAIQMTEASILACNLLEDIQNCRYGETCPLSIPCSRSVTQVSPDADYTLIDTDGDGAGGLNDFGAGEAPDATYSLCDMTLLLNVADDTPSEGNKTIRVRVEWEDQGGRHGFEFDVLKTEVM